MIPTFKAFNLFHNTFVFFHLIQEHASIAHVSHGIHRVISDKVHCILVFVFIPQSLIQIHHCCSDIRPDLIKFSIGHSPYRMTAAISGQTKPLNIR